MEDLLYLVHPNNTITPVDSLTIPSLEARRKSLQAELSTKSNETDHELVTWELQYIEAYLNIMRKVKSICTTCDTKEEGYDYDREDELLDEISDDMAKLKRAESEVTLSRSQSSSRKGSGAQVTHMEHAGTI